MSRRPAAPKSLAGLDVFGRMLEFLERPGAGTRRAFYGRLLQGLCEAAGCPHGSLLLADAVAGAGAPQLRLEAVHGLASETWGGEAPTDDTLVMEAARQGLPAVRQLSLGPTLALPLRWHEQLCGVLVLVSSEEALFDAERVAEAEALAEPLAGALWAARSLGLRQRSDDRLAALIQAGNAIVGGHGLQETLRRLLAESERLLDAEGSAVFLARDDGSLVTEIATGQGGEALQQLVLQPGEGIAGQVAQSRQSLLIENAADDPRVAKRVDQQTHTRTRNLVAAPILMDQRLLGVLELINKRGLAVFGPEDLRLLEALAALAAVALEKGRMVDGLEERARRLNLALSESSLETSEARKRLESVLFAMEDGVLAADENGRVNMVNRAAQVLVFGMLGTDPKGRFLSEIFDDPAFDERLRDVRATGQAVTLELDLARPEPRAWACMITPIRDLEGYLSGLVLVLRDITRFRELERMKSAFLNTVSHELRTPITSIRAFSEMMARPDVDMTKTREWATIINQESERLNRLIDDLLDVSRIESGKKLSIQKRPVDLEPLLKRVVALFAGQSAAHQIKLRINEGLKSAELDPDRFTQVLSNLLSNAIKYSPKGGDVELTMDFSPPESLRIEVRDHGMGLKAKDREMIFQKFYRVDHAEQAGIRGTGLGLSISKYLVEQHGGRMGVESEPGQGSTFWFELPLFAAPEPPPA